MATFLGTNAVVVTRGHCNNTVFIHLLHTQIPHVQLSEYVYNVERKIFSSLKHGYSNILFFFPIKNGKFSDKKNLVFFMFLLKT